LLAVRYILSNCFSTTFKEGIKMTAYQPAQRPGPSGWELFERDQKRLKTIAVSLFTTGLAITGMGIWQGTHPAQASPAITQPGCDKTSDIRDTGVGPVRVDVAAYFAERAAAKKALG
jgi:hypothetical protein